MNFIGYRRPDGRVGTRNYVGIISTVVCANEVAKGVADKVSGRLHLPTNRDVAKRRRI